MHVCIKTLTTFWLREKYQIIFWARDMGCGTRGRVESGTLAQGYVNISVKLSKDTVRMWTNWQENAVTMAACEVLNLFCAQISHGKMDQQTSGRILKAGNHQLLLPSSLGYNTFLLTFQHSGVPESSSPSVSPPLLPAHIPVSVSVTDPFLATIDKFGVRWVYNWYLMKWGLFSEFSLLNRFVKKQGHPCSPNTVNHVTRNHSSEPSV